MNTTKQVQQIVSRWDGAKVLFECELPDGIESGMAMRHALEKAVEGGANLRDANLDGANLSGANLSGAYLENVPAEKQIEVLDKVREIILDNAARLDMSGWHGDDGWKDRTCAEETLCGTTHCLAGWLQVCSTDPEIRKKDAEFAGFLCAPIAAPMFFTSGEKALTWLRDREYVNQLETLAKVAA